MRSGAPDELSSKTVMTQGGNMKLAGLCMLVAVGVAPRVARADAPVSGSVLGQLEAVLQHCGWADAPNGERYKQFAKGLVGNTTDKELAEVRESAEYRSAYDSANDQIGKLSKEESEKVCAEGLQQAGR